VTRADTEQASDTQLVQQMSQGDQAAISILYDRYSGLMMGVALRFLTERSAAEDLVHDVFLEAWKNADRFEAGRGSVKTWLLVRLRSRALDRLRSASRTRRVATDGVNLPEPRTASDEDPGLSPDRRAIHALLSSLSDGQRAVLELAYFHGLSSSEIGSKLGLPVGTVKSRTSAALGKLRNHLGERGSS